MLETQWQSTDLISCRMDRRSLCARRRRMPHRAAASPAGNPRKLQAAAAQRAEKVEVRRSESVAPLHPAAGGYIAVDGGDSSRGIRGLLAVARFGASRSGLSHNSGSDLLSRGKSRCDGVGGNGATREAIRTGSWIEPDDFNEFGRQLDHRAAIRARVEYRCRRTRSSGSDQCRADVFAVGFAGAADLQQVESRGYPNPDAGAELQDSAAVAGRRSRGHSAGPKDIAVTRRWTGQHQRGSEARGADSGESHTAFGARNQSRGRTHSDPTDQPRSGERQFRRPTAGLSDSIERSTSNERRF